MTATIKSWRSGQIPGLEALEMTEIPMPVSDRGTMVVEVCAGALNFSDLLMIDGKYQVRPPRPFTPGQEISGIVVDAPKASGWSPGDRIASKVVWGGFAEYAAVRTDMAIRIPDSLAFANAAALPVSYTTAMVALHECASLKAEHTILIHAAAGGTGLAATEIAHAAGARIIATAGSADKLALARDHGADLGINYRTDDWVAAVMEQTGGTGADIIFDPVGGEIGETSLRCIAWDGTLLVVGFASGKVPKLPAQRLLLKRAAAKGVMWDHDVDQDLLARTTDRLMTMLNAGRIDPVVNDDYGFSDLPKALADLSNRASVGKLVIRMKDEPGKSA